jgi:diphthamide synthase (EF-2-diphthine--ammonia ligase)
VFEPTSPYFHVPLFPIAFGDLFLEDIRAYRSTQLEGSGLKPLFPIWQEPTEPLARRMIDAGVEAFLTCVDPKKLSRSFAGRKFDHAFLNDLPEGVDPCGEKGEFHTCVLAGPMFRQPVPAAVGEVVERDGFYFADLVSVVPMVDAQQAANNFMQPTGNNGGQCPLRLFRIDLSTLVRFR